MIKQINVNDILVYPFTSDLELLDFIESKKGILIAVNAEKILHATQQTRNIINRNVGYSDGVGTVMALKKKGFKDAIKIPGCELWLKLIEFLYTNNKTFYLVGGKEEVINNTVSKLQTEYPNINIVHIFLYNYI